MIQLILGWRVVKAIFEKVRFMHKQDLQDKSDVWDTTYPKRLRELLAATLARSARRRRTRSERHPGQLGKNMV